ncbi:hypothetical protein M1555_05135 [Patescibacteria group bacterium]|nr:hypothetical protein [Patescibacteria group bacterium]
MSFFLDIFRPKNTITVVDFNGLQGVVMGTPDRSPVWVKNTAQNLQIARREGVRPLCFADVLSQIEPEQLSIIVLFDTPPNTPLTGNHWRVDSIDQQNQTVTLQHCNGWGNSDHSWVQPLEAPYDWPLFSGISVHQYNYAGLVLPLVDVARRYDEDSPDIPFLSHKESIFFSNAEGTLTELTYES